MLCVLALGLTACSSSQPVCPCAEADDDYSDAWTSFFGTAPEPFFSFRSDTLAFTLPERSEGHRFVQPESDTVRVLPDSLLRRFQQWRLHDQDRAAWAAEMDPGILIQPDSSVDGAMRVIPPTVPPHAMRNFAPERFTRPPALRVPKSFGRLPSRRFYFRRHQGLKD